MDDIRIGVIGSGGRGAIARFAHQPGKGSRIVACADTRPDILAENREAYGKDIFTTDDYRRLLDQKLDAVFVTSPDWLHEEQAAAAMELGLGVFLEKPMAITIEGCDRLLALSRRKKARLFVGHNMRYMPLIRKMKALVDKGAIGRVKSVWCRHFINYGGDAYFRDWHSERKLATGLLLQKGAHDIDVMHWITGAYSRRVTAFGNLSVYGDLPRLPEGVRGRAVFDAAHWPPKACKDFSHDIDVEDQTTMIMEMEGGILGAYLQCHFAPDTCRNYTFIGDEGRIENLGDVLESPIMLFNKRKEYRLIGDEVHYGDQPEGGDAGHGGADDKIVEEFVRFVREGGETTATPEAARMAVAAGYQATMSLRDGGRPRDVPPLP